LQPYRKPRFRQPNATFQSSLPGSKDGAFELTQDSKGVTNMLEVCSCWGMQKFADRKSDESPRIASFFEKSINDDHRPCRVWLCEQVTAAV
jgi:hypothetical protein